MIGIGNIYFDKIWMSENYSKFIKIFKKKNDQISKWY